MNSPEAVRKHDGRVVAYDAAGLAVSIERAARAANISLVPAAAAVLAQEALLQCLLVVHPDLK